MRCPKCGYNSFDHLDSCKKCGKDLVEHKQKFGIVSVLFPGQMAPAGMAAFATEDADVEDVVTAASAATGGESLAAAQDFSTASTAGREPGESDDFGFDFMGDSEEEEDLSFDELFEEASAEDDVEETLPSPEQKAADKEDEAFAFDPEKDAGGADSELEDDFGFDPTEDEEIEGNDFSFEPETDATEGAEEDPKSPFDLPESAQHEGTPEFIDNIFPEETEPASATVAEDELLSAELFSAIETDREDPALLDELSEDDDSAADELILDSEVDAESEQPAAADLAVEPEDPQAAAFARFPSAQALMAELEAEPTEDIATASEAESAASDVVAPAAEAVAAELDSPLSASGSLFVDQSAETAVAAVKNQEFPAIGKRVAAFGCDLLLLFLIGTSFVVAAEAAMTPGAASLLPSMERLIDLSIPYFLVLFSLSFGYFTLFHFLAGQTPGKMLVGLRVETTEGEALLFSQAFLRAVGGLLQALPVGLGYLVILSRSDRRGWNDRLAGTRVISLQGAAEEL